MWGESWLCYYYGQILRVKEGGQKKRRLRAPFSSSLPYYSIWQLSPPVSLPCCCTDLLHFLTPFCALQRQATDIKLAVVDHSNPEVATKNIFLFSSLPHRASSPTGPTIDKLFAVPGRSAMKSQRSLQLEFTEINCPSTARDTAHDLYLKSRQECCQSRSMRIEILNSPVISTIPENSQIMRDPHPHRENCPAPGTRFR